MATKVGKLRMVHHPECGMVQGAEHTGENTGRALNQETMVSTYQKATASLNSAPTTTMDLPRHSSSGRKLLPKCQAAGCALLLFHYRMVVVSTPMEGVYR